MKKNIRMTLTKIKCPDCGEFIFPINGTTKTTNSYNDCLRRCEKCEIGFSNSKNNPTVIYKNYSHNVPELLRQDLDFSLNHSVNEMNRKNKKNKFGFSTSEDALTWSFFKYFVVKNKLSELLEILNIESKHSTFDIYLWGTNICEINDDSNFIDKVIAVSDSFNEDSFKRTEPDVIIKLRDKLVFIEVKYLSSNELKTDKEKFEKYLIPGVAEKEVIESEHYELFRNWAFASKLSNGDDFELINLAPQRLFSDKNRNKLIQFENSLKSAKGNFRKLSWEEILEKVNDSENELWFKKYLDGKLNASR
jgi:hypothetical protein